MKIIKFSALFYLLMPTMALAAHQSATGKWWKSVPTAEQVSFVDGFMDCYVYDAGMGRDGLNMTSDFWTSQISSLYQKDADKILEPVSNVLESLIVGSHSKNPGHMTGETTTLEGKHSAYNSDLWRTRFPEERTGFVEGYLSCQKMFGKPNGTFSHPDDWYVSQISKWYGLKPDTDEIEENKARAKIADVLYIFRDVPHKE